jgi:restriction system protein
MGAIWFQAIDFANAMSELIGHKSGLALSRQDLIEHVQDEDDWADLFRLSDDETIRIRSEAVEALVAHLLYRVGNIETPDIRPPYDQNEAHPVVPGSSTYREAAEI